MKKSAKIDGEKRGEHIKSLCHGLMVNWSKWPRHESAWTGAGRRQSGTCWVGTLEVDRDSSCTRTITTRQLLLHSGLSLKFNDIHYPFPLIYSPYHTTGTWFSLSCHLNPSQEEDDTNQPPTPNPQPTPGNTEEQGGSGGGNDTGTFLDFGYATNFHNLNIVGKHVWSENMSCLCKFHQTFKVHHDSSCHVLCIFLDPSPDSDTESLFYIRNPRSNRGRNWNRNRGRNWNRGRRGRHWGGNWRGKWGGTWRGKWRGNSRRTNSRRTRRQQQWPSAGRWHRQFRLLWKGVWNCVRESGFWLKPRPGSRSQIEIEAAEVGWLEA